jgi:KDO2-lipid IV(A) lauroyltransferase
LGILPDQVPKHGEGIWLPWFKRPAYTITLPAKLHISTDAKLYIIAAIPTSIGWKIMCHPININNINNNNHSMITTEITDLINQTLETWVKRYPQYYAWSYHRYKGN